MREPCRRRLPPSAMGGGTPSLQRDLGFGGVSGTPSLKLGAWTCTRCLVTQARGSPNPPFRSYRPPDTGSVPIRPNARTAPAKPFLPRCEASVFGLAAPGPHPKGGERLAFYRGPVPSNAVVRPDHKPVPATAIILGMARLSRFVPFFQRRRAAAPPGPTHDVGSAEARGSRGGRKLVGKRLRASLALHERTAR